MFKFQLMFGLFLMISSMLIAEDKLSNFDYIILARKSDNNTTTLLLNKINDKVQKIVDVYNSSINEYYLVDEYNDDKTSNSILKFTRSGKSFIAFVISKNGILLSIEQSHGDEGSTLNFTYDTKLNISGVNGNWNIVTGGGNVPPSGKWPFPKDGQIDRINDDVFIYLHDEKSKFSYIQFGKTIPIELMLSYISLDLYENTIYEDKNYLHEGKNPWNSNREKLISGFIHSLSDNNLAIFRNLLFAVQGYTFKNNEILSYFKKFDWYKPSNEVENDSSILNLQEAKLLEMINIEANIRKK